jgi:hypothetical protein
VPEGVGMERGTQDAMASLRRGLPVVVGCPSVYINVPDSYHDTLAAVISASTQHGVHFVYIVPGLARAPRN